MSSSDSRRDFSIMSLFKARDWKDWRNSSMAPETLVRVLDLWAQGAVSAVWEENLDLPLDQVWHIRLRGVIP